MQKKVDAYFARCDEGTDRPVFKKGYPVIDPKTGQVVTCRRKIPYTIEGLVLGLDFCSRTALHDYSKKDGFKNVIMRAKSTIARDRVEGALSGEYDSKIAALDLTTNWGYTNKVKSEGSGGTHNTQVNIMIGDEHLDKALEIAKKTAETLKIEHEE